MQHGMINVVRCLSKEEVVHTNLAVSQYYDDNHRPFILSIAQVNSLTHNKTLKKIKTLKSR